MKWLVVKPDTGLYSTDQILSPIECRYHHTMRAAAAALIATCVLATSCTAGSCCGVSRADARCALVLGGHNVSYPNVFGHGTFLEAATALDEVWYISELRCSQLTDRFLCSAFFPPCHQRQDSHTASIETCMTVRQQCKPALVHWPSALSCDNFNTSHQSSQHRYRATPPVIIRLKRQQASRCQVNDSSLCTGKLIHNAHYTTTSFGGISNCTQSCRGVYFSDQQLTFLHYWTIAWSAISLASCIIALLVYIIYYRHVRHPEAPIYYIALCSVGVCLAYLLSKLTDKNALICDNQFNNSLNEPALISNLLDKPLCTFVFSAQYYFTMASWSWWLILTVEWLGVSLTDKYIPWKWQIVSHLLGWGTPVPFLLASVLMRAATGNSLLQICWFSLQHNGGRDQLVFVIAPLAVAVLFCSLLLICGFFISLCNLTQQEYRHRNKTVPRLLLCRASLFSSVVLMINGLLLCCNLYELFLHHEWEHFLLQGILYTRDAHCHQPREMIASTPNYPAVLTMIASSIATGVVILLWVPRRELFCCCRNRTAVFELNNSSERPKQSIDISLIEDYSNDSELTQ